MTTEVEKLMTFIRGNVARRTQKFEVCLTDRFMFANFMSDGISGMFLQELSEFMCSFGYSVRVEYNHWHSASFAMFTLDREPTDYATQNELANLKMKYLMSSGTGLYT